jgi:hypothetical protein
MAANHAGTVKYPNIFNETRVGAFTCRNRVKYAACSVSNFNTRDGFITDREYARMDVIARTGAGMITNQGAYPDAEGELQIQTLVNAQAKEITEEGVRVEEKDGAERVVPADTVILAIPRRPRQQLLSDLEFVCDELYVVGDAVKPRSMHNAIRDGYLIGIRI